jgi:ribosomal protein L30
MAEKKEVAKTEAKKPVAKVEVKKEAVKPAAAAVKAPAKATAAKPAAVAKPVAAKPAATAKAATPAKAEVKPVAKPAVKPVAAKTKEKKKAPYVSNGTMNVTLVHGVAGCTKKQIRTVQALGLKKIGDVKLHKDNVAIAGMVRVVAHLVKVEKIS